MSTLYKRTGRNSSMWRSRFAGKNVHVRLSADKSVSARMARHLDNLVSHGQGESLMPETRQWLDGLQDRLPHIFKQLLKHGLLPGELGRSLDDLLDEYEISLRSHDRAPLYIQNTVNAVRRVKGDLKWKRPGDMKAKALADWLTERKDEGLSLKSLEGYWESLSRFANYLLRNQVLSENPFRFKPEFNVEADLRHARRVLRPEEVASLLDTTAKSRDSVCCLTGSQRAMLYRAAAQTGLRAKELRSMTPESFGIDESGPYYVVQGNISKHRRVDQNPLLPDFVPTLRKYLRTIEPGEPLWPGKWLSKQARMLRYDLAKAGIPYKTERGFADFHSLRKFFVTELVKTNMPPKMVMQLARHTDANLSFKTYAQIRLNDITPHLAKVASLPVVLPVVEVKTGTDNLPVERHLKRHLGVSPTGQPCHSLAHASHLPDGENTLENKGSGTGGRVLSLTGTLGENWALQDSNL